MVALHGLGYVACDTLGDEFFVGPVGEGGCRLAVGKAHADGLVGADTSVGVHLVVVGDEVLAGSGLGVIA